MSFVVTLSLFEWKDFFDIFLHIINRGNPRLTLLLYNAIRPKSMFCNPSTSHQQELLFGQMSEFKDIRSTQSRRAQSMVEIYVMYFTHPEYE